MAPRKCLWLIALLLASLLVPATPAVAAPTAPPAASPCQSLPLVVQPACYAREKIGAVLDGAGGFIGDPVGTVAGAVGNSAMDALTGFVVDGAVWFLTAITEAVTSSTQVTVTSTWFNKHYAAMTGLAAVFALLLGHARK